MLLCWSISHWQKSATVTTFTGYKQHLYTQCIHSLCAFLHSPKRGCYWWHASMHWATTADTFTLDEVEQFQPRFLESTDSRYALWLKTLYPQSHAKARPGDLETILRRPPPPAQRKADKYPLNCWQVLTSEQCVGHPMGSALHPCQHPTPLQTGRGSGQFMSIAYTSASNEMQMIHSQTWWQITHPGSHQLWNTKSSQRRKLLNHTPWQNAPLSFPYWQSLATCPGRPHTKHPLDLGHCRWRCPGWWQR